MAKTNLIGKDHNAHLNWLLNSWMSSNSPVCFLEGFPGTGKTAIARELLEQAINAKLTAIMITSPETEKDPTDDLLLDLAMELNSAGRNELVQAIENNRPLLDVLSDLVNEPILIIIDEFQRSMRGVRAITRGGFAKVLSGLANRKWLKGRILLLTNRLVERARWSEPYAIRTLHGMMPDDGVTLLEYFAREGGRIDEIEPERRHDVVKWLGGNPRAIRLLVRNLAYESLDELIGVQPELWEIRDRDVSPELIEDLERHLLEKTLAQLSDEYILALRRLSVLRKSFKRQAIERLFNDKSTYALFRREMVDRFFIERYKNWYSLHPIVREIGLQKLAQSPTDLQQAHSMVAPYYTRHFQGKRIVGWGALGGHFVEARYHLVKADKGSELRGIASRFQSYIFHALKGTSPIPRSAEELDERIAVLSALLETPGPKNLEYHLARLFQERNQRNDLRRGLHHVNRAKSKSDFVPAWLLCSELLDQMGQKDEAITVLKQGIDRISPSKSLVSLYDRCAKLLTRRRRNDEAIAILKQGIERIPPDKALVVLYDDLGRLLAQMNRDDEAVAILKRGIGHISPDKALVVLYDNIAKLLAQKEQNDEAISILKQGINRIPPNKALVSLYVSLADLLTQRERYDESIATLQQGINHIPPNKNAVDLYYRYGELLARKGQRKRAVAILKQGIDRIPPNKGVPIIYASCSELLFQLGQHSEGLALLKEGINRVPPNQGAPVIYLNCAKLLLASNRSAEAVEILLDGVQKISTNHALVEFLLFLYAALRDEEGIGLFMQSRGVIQTKYSALAHALHYQIKEQWTEAAKYAGQKRKSGIQYSTLAIIEAFSWLCIEQPEQALDAISKNLQNQRSQNHWLHAFIQLRIGNIEKARQALVEYDGQTRLLHSVTVQELLTLWDQPSKTLRQPDLAYYFPTLPPTLTGLSYSVTRIPYTPSVLPIKSETEQILSSCVIQEPDSARRKESGSGTIAVSEDYIDFDLHVASNGYTVASSLEGQATAYVPTEIPSNIRLSLQLIQQRQTNTDLLKELGNALYDWLFPNSIHTHFQQTEAAVRRDQANLRLRLRIEAAPIASLPLEFMYRATGGYFLAANPNTVLSRYLNLPLPSQNVRRRESPLHMLVIIADPVDQVRLNPEEWETLIKEALAKPLSDNQMTINIIQRATRKEIRGALLEQKPDIVQFIGHGIYQNGKGHLALVDEDTDRTWTVDDERFANLFMGFDDHLGLVVLATCESAQSDDPQSFLGIAPQLVQRGTPAVVAMQYSVYVKTAKVFLEDFYTSVAARKPVDWAVQAARNAVSLEFGLDNREFATPVLYMRGKDGKVF